MTPHSAATWLCAALSVALPVLIVARSEAQEPASSPDPQTPQATGKETFADVSAEYKQALLAEEAKVANEQYAASQAEDAVDEAKRMRQAYRTARQLFGEEHVILTASVYYGRNCPDSSGEDCARAGVAGILGLAWAGFGGNHKAQFLPRLQTEDESVAFMRFEQTARDLSETMSHAAEIADSPSVQEQVAIRGQFDTMADTFRDVLEREIEEDGKRSEEAQLLLECLEQLERAPDDPQDKLNQLDALWHQYELLYGPEYRVRRHTVLLSTAVGLPFDNSIDEIILLAPVAMEIGSSGWGVTLTGGPSVRYRDGNVGYWLGLGFSGEMSSDLVNSLNGASGWAAQLAE